MREHQANIRDYRTRKTHKGNTMGTKEDRQAAIEQANTLVQQPQNTSTLNNENTDQLPNHEQQRTPESSGSEQLWESKYKVLQGKYNSETKQLREKATDLETRLNSRAPDVGTSQYTSKIAELESKLNQMQQQAQQNQPGANPDGMNSSEHYAFLVDEYGPQLADAVKNMINSQKSPSSNDDLSQLKQQVGQLSEHNAQQSQKMKVDTITSILKQQGIEFTQLDNDPLFMAWLDEEDGRSGSSRLTSLRKAFGTGDIAKAADFYSDFTTQQRSQLQRNPLAENLGLPNSTDDSSTTDNESYWTGEMITRLYSDRRNKVISEAEFKRYEQDYNQAAAQGRVRD
jgi:hypothetical protein